MSMLDVVFQEEDGIFFFKQTRASGVLWKRLGWGVVIRDRGKTGE